LQAILSARERRNEDSSMPVTNIDDIIGQRKQGCVLDTRKTMGSKRKVSADWLLTYASADWLISYAISINWLVIN